MDAPLTALIVDGAAAGLCALALAAATTALRVVTHRAGLARWLTAPSRAVAALASVEALLAWGLWVTLAAVWLRAANGADDLTPRAWEQSLIALLAVAIPVTLVGTVPLLLVELAALLLAPRPERSEKSGFGV